MPRARLRSAIKDTGRVQRTGNTRIGRSARRPATGSQVSERTQNKVCLGARRTKSREIAMQQNQTLSQRFQQYRASKAVLFWACAGSVAVATIVGFSWGGWVTGSSAREMAGFGRAGAPGARRDRVRRPLHGRAGRGRPADRAEGRSRAPTRRASSSRKAAGRSSCRPAAPPTTKRLPTTARRPGCAPRSWRSARWPRPARRH